MRKLFTLTLALLASFSLWAADPAPVDNPATKTYGDITFLNVAGTAANRTDTEGKNYLTYGVYYVAKTMAITTWFNSSDGSPASNHESSGYSIDDAADYGFFPTSSTSSDINYGGTKCHSTRQRYFYVTGATSVAAIVRDGGTNNNKYAQMTIQTVAEDGTLGTATTIGNDYVSASAGYVLDGGELEPTNYYKISFTSPVASNSYMYQIRLGKTANCIDPESTIKGDTTLYVNSGYNIGFNSINTNGCTVDVKKNGAAAVDDVDYSKININNYTFLKAGEFVITISQAKDANNHCAVEESVTVTVLDATPVAAVTVAGETNAYVGAELTYTATAANATAYEWYLDGVKQGSDSTKFIYTAVKGSHSIVCKARNEFNEEDEWIASDPIALNVTKLCGELIKATHTGATTATVTGVVGGTVDKNIAGDGKFGGKGQYFGLTLASGTFQAGDQINVNLKTAGQQGTIAVYAEKTGTTLLYSADSIGAVGDNIFTLPATVDGKSTIYVCRTEANTWNGYVNYISVSRSCEDSDDASVKSLTVNGEAVAKDAELNKFEYTVSTNYAEENVTVAFTIHPLATSDKVGNTFTIPTPSAGDTNGASFKVTAEDGTQVTYTVFISKAASLSDDATLKALSVEGYEISPAFDAETTAYTITKAYGAETPAVGKVTATPNDANANAEVVLAADVYTITVTAEDGTTTKEYTITVNTADAKKDLLEASFSNGANGYILNGNIRVPYLEGTSEPTFTAARFWNADGEPTAEIVDGKLVVTGADAKTAQYTIEYVEVTPMEASYDLITFTEVPSYIFSVYGWASDKGVKFSKDVEEAGTKRVSEGRDRIYIALPAAKSIILTGGSAGARPIKVTVNGVVDSKVTSTPAKDETITISLNQSAANFIGIESNGNNGDAGFTKMQLVQSDPTALDNTVDEIKAVKFVENGHLFIRRGEKVYTITGEEVK